MDEHLHENQAGMAGRETGEEQYGTGQDLIPGWQKYPEQERYPDSGLYPGWQQQTVFYGQPGMEPGGNYGMDGPGQKNTMALASMVMGILSIVTACCFPAGFVLGGMAVIFAALSRVEENLCGRGKAGLITGIVGIAAGFISAALWIFLST